MAYNMSMYETNKRLPHLRMEAVWMVRSGHGVREVARYFGYTPSAISKWVARVEILQYRLLQEEMPVSLSSMKRTLRRHHLSRFSRWKKWHLYPLRPHPETPGILVEIDTAHDGDPKERLGLYTLIDVCSHVAYATFTIGMNTHKSPRFVEDAQRVFPFPFQVIQSDHGSEFSKWFTKRLVERGIAHRHSRIRTPNDNAHLERFNRTIQEKCISRLPRKIGIWRKEIPEYLHYYNQERPHMGLGMRTPADILKVFPRS